MDLAKLIVPSKTVWADYPGFEDFKVQLAYLTRDELMKLREKAVTKKISRKTRQPEEEVDSELFQRLYIKSVILDWSGLKYKYLAKLVPVDLSSVEDTEEELEYSEANANLLMKNGVDFDAWVTEMLDDVSNFTKSN